MTQEELAIFVRYSKGLVWFSNPMWDLVHACTITFILSIPCNVGYHNLLHLNSWHPCLEPRCVVMPLSQMALPSWFWYHLSHLKEVIEYTGGPQPPICYHERFSPHHGWALFLTKGWVFSSHQGWAISFHALLSDVQNIPLGHLQCYSHYSCTHRHGFRLHH